MAPRSTARGAPYTLCRARRIQFRRSTVVVLVVPVGAPFVHVRRDAEETEVGRLAERHRPGRLQWTASAVWNPAGHDVAPWKERRLSPARGEFPFRFGRQPDGTPFRLRAPLAIGGG